MKNLFLLFMTLVLPVVVSAQDFKLTDGGYFHSGGVDVMVFDDIYPEGHQGGVGLIMHGQRIATNGDLRLEATPGQWQPVPKQLSRKIDGSSITTTLCYPDSSRHMTGFNPMIYPELQLRYDVRVESRGRSIVVTVDLDRPIPAELVGKVGFNFEFYPGVLFGKPWIMDTQSGIYPQQPNSPLAFSEPNYKHTGSYHQQGKPEADFNQLIGSGYSPMVADDIIAEPYAVGRKFTSRPDDPLQRVTIESMAGDLKLYDGRMNHNNGWFVLRSEVQPGATKGAVQWVITPNVVSGWRYKPVVQTSQVGYLLAQKKEAVIELDANESISGKVEVYRIDPDGEHLVRTLTPVSWGKFLRYNYLKADFTDIREPGLYQVRYDESRSSVFRIGPDVFTRGVWQPVVEYFLPVQMCHMRVSEKYRVWHGACHLDDALMAPAHSHIDGYAQQAGLSRYAALEKVAGVNVGGWHDAGDYDLRIESQAGEAYILAQAMEQFHPELDVTSIDYAKHETEIHQPDGRNDVMQQIENGALTVVNGYLALGRLYRGIICNSVRQYVLLGDASTMTDGKPGNSDDRWIFTEDNPQREMTTAAQLAGVGRCLRGFNDTLSTHCIQIAQTLYRQTRYEGLEKVHAALELLTATGDKSYERYIISRKKDIIGHIADCGWYLAEWSLTAPAAFRRDFAKALATYSREVHSLAAETPYGVPYRPQIWGAGWDIQSFAFRHYFLHKAYPQLFSPQLLYSALNFVLGCHPGSNTASFASGVGARSTTVAYGMNRADWSYIPGGVASGTALIRPDYPELLDFPFLWQQMEYCLGGASSHYLFMVLAACNSRD
jgi:hypothetical protein